MAFSSYPTTRSQPIVLAPSVEAQVYGLFAAAMAITLIGVFLGMQLAGLLLTSGLHMFLLLGELAIVFSARWWIEKSPLNLLLFGLFPLLSGITFTPYILMVLSGYVNGASILLNALAATVFMVGAVAVFARTTTWNLEGLGRGLFFALLGLLFLGILQLLFPALRGTQPELLISGGGVVVFALFTAYDLQRVQALSRVGANPFILALSLYLDMFNLLTSVLRFMVALSGERR